MPIVRQVQVFWFRCLGFHQSLESMQDFLAIHTSRRPDLNMKRCDSKLFAARGRILGC